MTSIRENRITSITVPPVWNATQEGITKIKDSL
jgi:hypothetical protein